MVRWPRKIGQVAKVYSTERGEFKAKVGLEALRGDKTIQEIAVWHKVHPNQVSVWKQRAVEGMKEVFTKGGSMRREGAS